MHIRFIALLILLAGAFVAACGSDEAVATTHADTHLLIADPAASRLYVYEVPAHKPIAEFEDVAPNTHVGFVALPDGRVLFVDDVAEEVVVLRVAAGGAEIEARVASGPGIHLAVDPEARYAAVSSGRYDPVTWALSEAAMTLVDLDTYERVQFEVQTGEPGVLLGGEPLQLFHRNDNPAQLEAYPVSDLLRGRFTYTERVAIGEAGHGEAIAHALGRMYLATDDGLEVVGFEGDALEHLTTVPWDASGRTGGRAFYLRLGVEGRTVITYMANRQPGTPWGEWQNDAYLLRTDTLEATRVALGQGMVWRLGLGGSYAVFFNVTPEGHPEGDQAYLLNTDPESQDFGTLIAKLALPPLQHRPSPDAPPWEQAGVEDRRATLTPDGRYAYVSNGGEGKISVIDTQARAISETIEVKTALRGGGYLFAVQADMPFTETLAK
jgi:YVTN family beta-propeller protein